MLQQAFAEVSFEQDRKLTRRGRFLDERQREVMGWTVSNGKA